MMIRVAPTVLAILPMPNGRAARVLQGVAGYEVDVPDIPELGVYVLAIAFQRYGGPAAGDPAAFLIKTAREMIPGVGVELLMETATGGDGEVY